MGTKWEYVEFFKAFEMEHTGFTRWLSVGSGYCGYPPEHAFTLNDLGDDGWNLCGIIELGDSPKQQRAIFKRPK